MGLKKILLAIALSLVLLPVTPAMAQTTTVNDVAEELICQCGCDRMLNSHVCDTQEAMVTLIEQKLAQGQSKEEIIQFFVTQYGEQVLASPPKRGFNLMAWILPFVAILGGGGVIYIAIKKWVRRGRETLATTMAEVEEGDEEYQRRLEKELAEFPDRSFR
jgi:cytochrome c-type biogenesis protein CcmH